MTDTTTTAPASKDPKELKKEVARHNMEGSTPMMAPADAAPDPAHATEDSPLTDAEALAVGHTVAMRYVPPDPPPSVLEQIEAMKNPQPK